MTTTEAIAAVRHHLDRVAAFIRTDRPSPLSVVIPPDVFDALGLDATALNYAEVGPAIFVRLEREPSTQIQTTIDSWRLRNSWSATICGMKLSNPHDRPAICHVVDWDAIETNARVMGAVGAKP